MMFPTTRLRRLRQHPILQELVQETQLCLNDFVFPLFIKADIQEKRPITSMPGHFQLPLSELAQELEELQKLKLSSVMLFGVPSSKDETGECSFHSEGIIQQAVKKIRAVAPQMLIITDLCLCEYTSHGHCGVLKQREGSLDVDNDATLSVLVQQAVSLAQSGAHVIAPSGMMDGMVKSVREGLDRAGFEHIPILSYSVKYNSALYGPFREAAEGAPRFGNRSTHQLDPANAQEGLREAHHDVMEGADMLMVKPAASYLDVIFRIKQAHPHIPLGAYHTSGEFCMLKAASACGYLDEQKATLEILKGIRRAGADFIITYCAKEVAAWLR